jgi:Cof subfamily protein (haloacid dehalogenase superfamily)
VSEIHGKISLLVSDVDGTLVTNDKVLTPRARDAVKRLDDAGIAFAVTSSRPPRGLEMLVEPLNIRTPLGGFNGGTLVRPDMTIIEKLSLTPDAARQAIAIILDHGMDAWVYTESDWFVRDLAAPHVAREQFTIGFPPIVVKDFGGALDHAEKIVAVCDDYEVVSRCNAALDTALRGKASATRSQLYFIDITHLDANKGVLVETLSRMLSIPPLEIATIGDMQNDVLMFRKSGMSIAMGNAKPDVQSQAKFVTASNEDDGFAKAVENYLLGD